jgi:hypothetical protein
MSGVRYDLVRLRSSGTLVLEPAKTLKPAPR